MKISQLRPCDACGKKIVPTFYVVRFSLAVIDYRAINENLGLMQMLGGSVSLAEVMTSQPEVVTVTGDEDKSLQTEVYICTDCFLHGVNLALLQERIESKDEVQ